MRRLALLASLLALAACDDGKVTEVARFPSPVGGLDAVVGHISAGDSQPWMVVMTKPGENPAKGARILLTDKGSQPMVEWVDPYHVILRCDGPARIWTYRNFWTDPSGKATVSAALECGQGGWKP